MNLGSPLVIKLIVGKAASIFGHMAWHLPGSHTRGSFVYWVCPFLVYAQLPFGYFRLMFYGYLSFCSAVLQLSHNQLSGSIPVQIGYVKRVTVIALQHNRLTGAIPASIGLLVMLKRLDLSFNVLVGLVPWSLADLSQLEVLDHRNNSFSGPVPPVRMIDWFQSCQTPFFGSWALKAAWRLKLI